MGFLNAMPLLPVCSTEIFRCAGWKGVECTRTIADAVRKLMRASESSSGEELNQMQLLFFPVEWVTSGLKAIDSSYAEAFLFISTRC
jgi:hypothetical protein